MDKSPGLLVLMYAITTFHGLPFVNFCCFIGDHKQLRNLPSDGTKVRSVCIQRFERLRFSNLLRDKLPLTLLHWRNFDSLKPTLTQ
ncbi:hypothetical protein ASPFODRAFT_54278 [Aspergillus luchuensis CBS 106.47]|uniref:Uncharacterized protein n=1 Tax=Aspergillus luchuensis (strain CBS 106.47) TaxID=1137211 RepID=A0A1M3SZK3_ASPLC|nr:hypothetical protein ASPFODRAFT_54278 [Aspergillus luchuensis CBS 106.47]